MISDTVLVAVGVGEGDGVHVKLGVGVDVRVGVFEGVGVKVSVIGMFFLSGSKWTIGGSVAGPSFPTRESTHSNPNTTTKKLITPAMINNPIRCTVNQLASRLPVSLWGGVCKLFAISWRA